MQPEAEELLKEELFGYVATSGLDRVPHVTPVIFVYDGGKIFFSTSKQARKLRNIQENPKVSFVVHAGDPLNPFADKTVIVFGRAKIYDLSSSALRSSRLLRVLALFPLKYPDYARAYGSGTVKLPKAWRPTLFIRRLIVEISIHKVMVLVGTSG